MTKFAGDSKFIIEMHSIVLQAWYQYTRGEYTHDKQEAICFAMGNVKLYQFY